MSVASLAPANSQRSRSTAIKSFEAFLATQSIAIAEARARIAEDTTGKSLYIILDKFGWSLVTKDGRQGKALARNSVISYFGNVKNWLVELYPQQSQAVSKRLQKMLAALDRHCAKRATEGVVKQAPPCTKRDLAIIGSCIYESATNSSDYLDAALVVMMWYLYGCGSDAEQLEKSQLCVYPGGIIFMRFKRVKTATQQGVSLFKDPSDFFTCPLHVLAVATVMQTALASRIFPQFSHAAGAPGIDDDNDDEVGLIELLNDDGEGDFMEQASEGIGKRKSVVPGAQAYINRLLASVYKLSSTREVRLTANLSSHSFRRGGAMHANADSRINPLWVVERGGWNMSRVSKAFFYMLSTTQEDQQVARQLSGWHPQTGAKLPDLSALAPLVRSRAYKLQQALFSAACGFLNSKWNFDEQMLEVFMATVVLHYPDMLLHRPSSPYIHRVQEALAASELQESELLSWSAAIRYSAQAQPEEKDVLQEQELLALTKKQSQQLDLVVVQLKRLEERLTALENKQTRGTESIDSTAPTQTTHTTDERQQLDPPTRLRKQAAKALAVAWYEWFCAEPRVYKSTSISKEKLHECRHVVAYMMLFLSDGYALDTSSPSYKAQVQALGEEAEANTLAFLLYHGSRASASGSVVKAMRDLQKRGILDAHIAQFRQLLVDGRILDPTPQHALPPFMRTS